MGGTLNQLEWRLGLAKSSEGKDLNSPSSHKPADFWNRWAYPNPAYADLKHRISKESLCCYNPSWVCRGLTPGQHGELCKRNGKVIHDAATASTAFPPSRQLRRRKNIIIHDDGTSFVASLRACTKNKDLRRGTRLHDNILNRGLLEKCSDALLTMYAKCGALAKAKELLDMHKTRDVSSWTALIVGYMRQGRSQDALNCFKQMQGEGLSPNAVIFSCILKACGSLGAVEQGKQIHDEIARQGLLEYDVVLGTALVDMYAKCGALAKAQCVLDELPSRDVFSWSALIAGYAQQGQGEQALHCFECMQREGVPPNEVTFACILKACGTLGAVTKGKQIHDQISRRGLLGNNIVLGNALVDMYAKCGVLAKAQRVLEGLPSRNVISWTALIGGYAQHGQGEQALSCFERMQCEGVPPNEVTFACVLKACGTIGAADKGKQIHDQIARQGLLGKSIVLDNALVDMYAKCGALDKAQHVLEELPSLDVISWNTLIAGYVQEGQCEHALNCFERMQREGIAPNSVTFACIVKACGTLGAIDKGEQIHDKIARWGLLGSDVVLGAALVDMYAKCGALAKAQRVLEELPSRDAVAWNTLIAGYVQQGQSGQALSCLERMQLEGISPNRATFSCVLNVCSHLGRVEDGHMYFVSMSTKYGVKPDLEIYTCMIDLFGRAGHLEKAVGVIQQMPCSDFSEVWHALLGACRKWGDADLGRWAFEQAVEVDKSDGVAYVLMANIYAAAGMQENAKDIESMRMENKAWKKPGRSLWIDMVGNTHVFSIGDTHTTFIHTKLKDIAHKMSQQGYPSGLHGVSCNIFGSGKEYVLCLSL